MALKLSPVLRRVKIALIVPLVLVGMAVGWLSDRAHEFFHFLVLKCGLAHFENWLKRRSIWFASVVFAVLLWGFVWFKTYEIALILNHHVVKALSLGLVFKVTYLGTANYLIRIYAERFLAIRWIKWLYDRYANVRDRIVGYIKQTAAYRIAHSIRLRLAALISRRSLWRAVKRRYAKGR
ncbi:hypothetical protein HYT05_01355 [Candidatus Kaiserbacteria bacterium]|nr:hypothetical protein [Candidatus Kaiserbacteria bacterium]